MIMDYSRPGKPSDNLNGKFRDECLNIHWFLSLEDAWGTIEVRRVEYDGYRSHTSWDDLSPLEFEESFENKPENYFRVVLKYGWTSMQLEFYSFERYRQRVFKIILRMARKTVSRFGWSIEFDLSAKN